MSILSLHSWPLGAFVVVTLLQGNTAKLCDTVQGTLDGCYECYPCHYEVVTHAYHHAAVRKLKLYNATCHPNEVCCVPKITTVTRSSSDCGRRAEVEEREEARGIVQGELPWMAFVYRMQGTTEKLLCSASFVSEDTASLLTSATCVQDVPASELRVSFDLPTYNGSRKMAAVKEVIVHEDYNAANHTNDVAVLKLVSLDDIPLWAKTVCLPVEKTLHGTDCVTVSSQDYYFINEEVTLREVCGAAAGAGVAPRQLCAAAPAGPANSLRPMNGAGLFCEGRDREYVLAGVALRRDAAAAGTHSVYSDAWALSAWIEQNTKI